MLAKAFVQVYTGNGKGKTTAALGLALRAAGAGLRVFIGQFMKHGDYSEMRGLDRLQPQVQVEQFGTDRWVRQPIQDEDREAARTGLRRAREVLARAEHDLVILDEINVALHYKLVSRTEMAALLSARPENVEIVLTGRRAPAWLTDEADLVTEMREVKHYMQQGVPARVGIEK